MKKYNCHMIRDLMPLCADHSAAKESEQAVIEHIAECPECGAYWEAISRALTIDRDANSGAADYLAIAKKLRRKRILTSAAIAVSVGLCSGFITLKAESYLYGYRASPEKTLSERVYDYDKLLCTCQWRNRNFYFYSNSLFTVCYGVEKDWKGWRHNVTYMNDPPDETAAETGIVNLMGGTIQYEDIDACLVMLPIQVTDKAVAAISYVIDEEEHRTPVNNGYIGVILYEENHANIRHMRLSDWRAYDKDGNLLYHSEYIDEYGSFVWVEHEK